MNEIDTAAVKAMWLAYRTAHPRIPDGAVPPAERFGDSPALADELLAFVTSGTKRATAGMVAEYRHEGESLPRIGDHWIACDGAGQPAVILRGTELRLGPLSSVDEKFAWDEGEYDRTLASWLDEHRRFFRRTCARLGINYSDDVELVFERFRVVWPHALADD